MILVKALYDYDGKDGGEPFKAGTTFWVLDDSHPHWWEASHNGALIWVPRVFLQVLKKDDSAVPPPPPTGTAHAPGSAAAGAGAASAAGADSDESNASQMRSPRPGAQPSAASQQARHAEPARASAGTEETPARRASSASSSGGVRRASVQSAGAARRATAHDDEATLGTRVTRGTAPSSAAAARAQQAEQQQQQQQQQQRRSASGGQAPGDVTNRSQLSTARSQRSGAGGFATRNAQASRQSNFSVSTASSAAGAGPVSPRGMRRPSTAGASSGPLGPSTTQGAAVNSSAMSSHSKLDNSHARSNSSMMSGENDGSLTRRSSLARKISTAELEDTFRRLTEPRMFTGTHKHRFDQQTGRGLGREGRDVLDQPTHLQMRPGIDHGPSMRPGGVNSVREYLEKLANGSGANASSASINTSGSRASIGSRPASAAARSSTPNGLRSSTPTRSIFDKLTDVRSFTGTHKHRFDQRTGRGLGREGRVDDVGQKDISEMCRPQLRRGASILHTGGTAIMSRRELEEFDKTLRTQRTASGSSFHS